MLNNNQTLDSNNYIKGLVSVIIPLFNRENYIVETLKSIDAQTYRPIECIVVDDGSEDMSKIVTENFIHSYKGDVAFILLCKKNTGVQNTRNYGTRYAKGEFIQYIDSDDILFDDKFKRQVDYLNKHKDFNAVFSPWSVGVSALQSKCSDEQKNIASIIDVNTYFKYGPIVNFSPLMKVQSIKEVGVWDEQLTINEELDYHIRFFVNGFKMGFLNYNCGLWREHQNFRLSETNSFNNLYYFYKKHELLLKKSGLWSDEISSNFGMRIFWKLVANKYSGFISRLKLIFLAVKFNKQLPLFQSKKVQILKSILGNSIATVLWFYTILPFVKKQEKKI